MVGTAQRSLLEAASTAGLAQPQRWTGPARVAVMPAYNEARTIIAVLDDLYPRVDRVVVVDDGSADGTGDLLDQWAVGRDRCTVIHFGENRGLSAALRAGWDEVRSLLQRGELRPDDVAFSIDADGQHEPSALDGMIDHLVRHRYDCVIGSRDLSYHTPYKLFGNHVMTWIGRLSGGTRFEDIESGYRVFRIGPLLEAQEYYEGYRYSETVEVAVILARLGYRVDNTYRVNIPVARTRTRLTDAAVDAVCMPLSWYRLAVWRDIPREFRSRFIVWAPVPVFVLAVVALTLMLTRPFYLGDDSAHSYAHVWYLSHAIFDLHQWPLHVATLENGDAVMFPYGFVPWFPSAMLYPLLGDWVVTASMVVGVVLLAVGVLLFRPTLRNPFLFALMLLNPFFWNGVTQFQLATFWAFALFFFGVWQFEREHRLRSTVLFALAISAHPFMALAALGLYGGWRWKEGEQPRRLAVQVVCAAALASPAIVFFLQTPAVRDTSPLVLLTSFVDDGRRLSMVLLALALPRMAGWIWRNHEGLLVTAGGATAAVLIAVPPSGLWEASRPRFADYLAEHPAQPGNHYRVAVKNNHEDGMIEFMKAGAVLAHEFFTESEYRRVWPNVETYTCYLATKRIDHVVVGGEYARRYRQSEEAMLRQLTARGLATEEYVGRDGTLAYAVDPPRSAARRSARDCGL